MSIFLSYGHDEYATLAQRLKSDLEEEGFEIWIDKEKIKGTSDWEISIEKGISSSDWMILLMTEHSVRRPDGVCLDEVSYARFLGKNIAPIMIQEVKPPLCIARIQWIDMKDFFTPGKLSFDEESYQEKKNELIAVIKGIQQLNIEGDQRSLRVRLDPLDNDVYSENLRKNFYGRQKLLSFYDEWYKSDKRILWLVGDAGIGKTAFVAFLCGCREEIQAVHFCRYNDNERANPKRAIMSIAYYLATQVPEYKKNILELHDLDTLIEKTTVRLFEYLIIEPLSKVKYDGNKIVIIIDALDEATINGRNELVDVISMHFEKTPDWMKLLITSRRESLLERKLVKFNPIDLSDSRFNDNEADIRGYFSIHLKDYLPSGKQQEHILDSLTQKSQGIFLYAKNVIEDIISNKLSIYDIDSFPDGLTGIYYDYFERIFREEQYLSYRKDVRPVMEILCATYMPVSTDLLLDILEIDDYDFEDILELICEMFPIRDGVVEPIHKSIIDWLTDSKRSGTYRVSIKKGHEKLADYYIELLKKEKTNKYALRYLCRHLISVGRFNEATELLDNREFQYNRIKMIGLDSHIREYLYELEELKNEDIEYAMNVMQSDTFVGLFSKYRKFFYNSGLYFTLKDCSFDEVLSCKTIAWDIDAEIGIAYYYYITESFSPAINKADELLTSCDNLTDVMKAELHNLIAMCYRKSVDFGKSEKHFRIALEVDKNTTSYYDQSISLICLGKIAYHELDWPAADQWNKKSIEHLLMELDKTSDSDYRTSLELFLAEYHRLVAECLIWDGQLDRVNHELEEAEKIYQRVSSRDRYYIRYLYTGAFKDILAGNYKSAYEECEILITQATSSYDKSQILFYKAIAAMKLNKIQESCKCIIEAHDYASSIGALLETEEIISLALMVNSGNAQLKRTQHYYDNPYIQNWITHVEGFLAKLAD